MRQALLPGTWQTSMARGGVKGGRVRQVITGINKSVDYTSPMTSSIQYTVAQVSVKN